MTDHQEVNLYNIKKSKVNQNCTKHHHKVVLILGAIVELKNKVPWQLHSQRFQHDGEISNSLPHYFNHCVGSASHHIVSVINI
jgi:hypothetical protein